MSKLICPFCQQELHKDSDGYYTCYTDNCGCMKYGGNGASGSESLWLALIRTRRALNVAVDALEKIGSGNIIEHFGCRTRRRQQNLYCQQSHRTNNSTRTKGCKMKCLWFGIKDYCKDCWHDWVLTRLVNTYENEKIEEGWLWKEGNLWHYIRQRKEHFADASKKIKKRK